MTETTVTDPISGLRVVELGTGVAAGYCGKLLADLGADVLKIEPVGGDPLRGYVSDGRALPAGTTGALYDHLTAAKRIVVADDEAVADQDPLSAADIVIVAPDVGPAAPAAHRPERLRAAHPGLIVVSITPFGISGPWAGRPASDITLQAWSGGILPRGVPDREPLSCGGRPGDWLGGLFGAVGALASWARTVLEGTGELVDVSVLECHVLCQQMYPVTWRTVAENGGPRARPLPVARSLNLPGIERARDGWVGFMVVTAAMWESFCIMIDHPEWLADEQLYLYEGRAARRDEIESAVRDWTANLTVAEVLDAADRYRVPAAPVADGANVLGFDHLDNDFFFESHPRSGVRQPRTAVAFTEGAAAPGAAPAPAPAAEASWRAARIERGRDSPSERAFSGRLRIADFTGFWAGPIVSQFMALHGADVIHVESVTRPDGMRGQTVLSAQDDAWWEWAPRFQGVNTGKRAVTIDMGSPEGREQARRLIAECDVVVENFSPRVIEKWGLAFDELQRIRPGIICLRMPAFGLDGPWRNRTGYAQNIEQASGLAWVTGFADGPPVVPNGMCDPLAGTAATVALLAALERRRRTGAGVLVEVPMIGSALNVAAEQIVEAQAYGRIAMRDGNRSTNLAVQNLYRTADAGPDGRRDTWVAIAAESDRQWRALASAVGAPDLLSDPGMDDPARRRRAQDRIDSRVSAWCASRTSAEVVDALWPAGVPVGAVLSPDRVDELEHLTERGFFEDHDHPVTGRGRYACHPVRFASDPRPVHPRPAPTLGQHNVEVFAELLGFGANEIADLQERGLIGTRPTGTHHTR